MRFKINTRQLAIKVADAGFAKTEDFCEACGIDKGNLYRYLKPDATANLSTVRKLAEALGCKPSEICEAVENDD